MSFEDFFNSRMGVMTVLGGYIKAVIEDQGLEKALEYNIRAAEIDAELITKDLASPDKYITPQDAKTILESHKTSGIKSTIEIVGNEVINNNRRCVYYDGWLAAGLEPEVIERLCRDRFTLGGEKVWKILNPGIETELRQFKDNPDGLCVEVIKFKE